MKKVNSVFIALLLCGCADASPTSSADLGEIGVRNTTYADASGEPYPTSASEFSTISFAKSAFIYPNCDLADNGCTVTLEMQHRGIWNSTEQVLTISNDGAPAPAMTYSDGAVCTLWENLPETKCVEKQVYRVLEYSIPCGQKISGTCGISLGGSVSGEEARVLAVQV